MTVFLVRHVQYQAFLLSHYSFLALQVSPGLMDYHPSLSRSQRTRNGGSREPSPSPSRSPFSMTSRSKPRDPNALIAGPAYSNHGGGNSLASPRPAHLQVEELEPPSLRKRLSSGMLGGLFKGSKVQEDSNQPVQRGF